jgi:hypothetical protein
VLHTIAMRVHARETGEGMGTLLAQPGRDGGEEGAAAPAAADADATGIDAAAAAGGGGDAEAAAPLPEGIDAKAAPATDPSDPLAYLRESTRVTADYLFGACGSERGRTRVGCCRSGCGDWVRLGCLV